MHRCGSSMAQKSVLRSADVKARRKALLLSALSRAATRTKMLMMTTTAAARTIRSFHSSRITFTESSSYWRQVFPAEKFVSVWEPHHFRDNGGSPSSISLLEREDPTLNVASKHVIHQLQQFYRRGYTFTPTFVTREWCHLILEQLSAAPTTATAGPTRNDTSSASWWERTQRADALLSAMHLMDPLQSRRTPFELPRPNGRTYRLVLEMYARFVPSREGASLDYDDEANLAAANRARDWVLRMQEEYRVGVDLSLQPSVVEWNLVLLAYANAPHVDRARRALAVLTQHMLLSDKSDANYLVDASSFLFLARACGYAAPNATAAQAGAHCAAQIWDLLLHTEVLRQRIVPTLQSQFYSLMLQSIRPMNQSELRERLFEEIFDQARNCGKLNHIIVKEFLLHAKPLALVDLILGPERLANVRGLSSQEAAKQLVASMPAEWSKNRDGH